MKIIRIGQNKYNFCALYIPSGSPSHVYEAVFVFLQNNLTHSDNTYIFGDFNIKAITGTVYNLDVSNNILEIFQEFMDFNGYVLYNNIKNFQDRTLDLVISSENNFRNIVVNRDFLPFVNEDIYHPSLEININIERSITPKNTEIVTRLNYKKADFLTFSERVRDMNWDAVLEEKFDVDKAVLNFYDKLE
uniref:Uncharacterized protein LOC114326509 n=1 Tax=Diabrotica virgifera virgifera TaxID=50390 RepID=A0A6P7F779_DIAVI